MLFNKKFVIISLAFLLSVVAVFQNCLPTEAQFKLENDSQKLDFLKLEIDAILAQDYCIEDSECESHPFGFKACGGPATYLVSSINNHPDELRTLIEEYNAAERDFCQLNGCMSNCAYLMPPEKLYCVNNRCSLEESAPRP